MVLLRHPLPGLIVMSYSGIVALYSEMVAGYIRRGQASALKRDGSVSDDGKFVSACGEFGWANGIVDVWEVRPEGFLPVFKITGNYRFSQFTPSNMLHVMRETVLESDTNSRGPKDNPISLENATLDFPSESAALAPVEIESIELV